MLHLTQIIHRAGGSSSSGILVPARPFFAVQSCVHMRLVRRGRHGRALTVSYGCKMSWLCPDPALHPHQHGTRERRSISKSSVSCIGTTTDFFSYYFFYKFWQRSFFFIIKIYVEFSTIVLSNDAICISSTSKCDSHSVCQHPYGLGRQPMFVPTTVA
jgi:hypothetical protein